MLDEVCDKAVIKNLGVIAKFIDETGQPVMKFLQVEEMTRSTGADIRDAVLKVVGEKELDPAKCVNLTSDGASSFSGKHNGAAVLLQREAMPHALIMHCHDHRLALVCRDAFKTIKALDNIAEGLDGLYKYYHYSSVSSATLRQLQDLYNNAHWKIQAAKHHRWLSYDKAVLCVLKGLDVIRQDLENTSSNENVDNTDKHKTDARALLSWITSERNIRMLCLLGDILPHLAELSLVFQRRSVEISMIEPKTQSTLSKIESLKQNDGAWEKKLLGPETSQSERPTITKQNCSKEDFEQTIRNPFINNIKEKIRDRFQNTEIISTLDLLCLPLDILDSLPLVNREEEIRTLSNHFDLDEDTVAMEWIGWLEFLKSLDTTPVNANLNEIGQLLLNKTSASEHIKETFPNLAFLYSVANVLTLSSAEVERLFSHLKIIKSDKRCSMSNKVLNWILNIKLKIDSEISENVKCYAAKKWLGNKKRRFGRYTCL